MYYGGINPGPPPTRGRQRCGVGWNPRPPPARGRQKKRRGDKTQEICHSREGGNPVLLTMAYAYVYLLASGRNGTLYVGVTSDLPKRIYEHKNHLAKGFTATYDVTQLVWFEGHDDITQAIWREKKIKKWNRAWKVRLIEANNPTWRDLAIELGLAAAP